jgi:prepilin-type N-terminal cleavage/methylation domain-containing protein
MKEEGFTLIELVVGVAIFLVFALGAYQGFRSVFASVSYLHFKSLASDLANEQFEIVKNLPYASVGIVNGDPAGVMPASQIIVRDRISFTSEMFIDNIDDPFDGTATSSPADVFPNDYKRVEVKISCDTCKNFTPIYVTSFIAPKNLEN